MALSPNRRKRKNCGEWLNLGLWEKTVVESQTGFYTRGVQELNASQKGLGSFSK